MLLSLSIRNVVLIDALDAMFERGLCALTGETGAGKSILLGALGLAAGERADRAQVRSGADEAQAIAEFELPEDHPARVLLEEAGLTVEPGEPVILRRRLSEDGRSRAHVNDQPASVGLLRSLGQLGRARRAPASRVPALLPRVGAPRAPISSRVAPPLGSAAGEAPHVCAALRGVLAPLALAAWLRWAGPCRVLLIRLDQARPLGGCGARVVRAGLRAGPPAAPAARLCAPCLRCRVGPLGRGCAVSGTACRVVSGSFRGHAQPHFSHAHAHAHSQCAYVQIACTWTCKGIPCSRGSHDLYACITHSCVCESRHWT